MSIDVINVINPQFIVYGEDRYFEYNNNKDVISLISFTNKSFCEKYLTEKREGENRG